MLTKEKEKVIADALLTEEGRDLLMEAMMLGVEKVFEKIYRLGDTVTVEDLDRMDRSIREDFSLGAVTVFKIRSYLARRRKELEESK